MPEPLKPVNTTIFGGVKVDTNRVAKFSEVKKNGAKRFVIDLKNGTKIEFPQQKPENNSQIKVYDVNENDTRISIENLAYGNIKGSPKDDLIYLEGCRGSVVDVSGGGTDKVHLSQFKKKSIDNKVIQDGNDFTELQITDTFATYRDHYPGDHIKKGEFRIIQGEGTVSEKDY